MKQIIKALTVVALMALSSCASIFVGTKDKITVASNAIEAKVSSNNTELGETPFKDKISKKETTIYTISKEGYLDQNVCFYTNDISWTIFLNLTNLGMFSSYDITFGGPTSMEKDHCKIELYKLPENVDGSQKVYFNKYIWDNNADDTLFTYKFNGVENETYTYDEFFEFYEENKNNEEIYDGPIKTQGKQSKLAEKMNCILTDLGYDVASNDNESIFSSSDAAYYITAKVLNAHIEYDILFSYSKPAPIKITSTLNISYTINDINDDDIFNSEETTTYTYFIDDESNFEDLSYEKSFYKFLNKKEVQDILQKEIEIDNSIPESERTIMAKNDSQKASLQHAIKSVVTIKINNGHASGCIVSQDGYIITNYHVINNDEKPLIILDDNTELPAKIIKKSKAYDLALLKVDAEGFSHFIVDSESIAQIGEDVYSVGTGGDIGLGQSLSKGIISGKRQFSGKQFLQTDVTINPGSSGGALIDTNGKLVGIVNAKIVGTSVEGIGFAIPLPMALQYLNIGYSKE